MGRRAHKPDAASRRQVEAMAGFGVPERDIAEVIEIDPKTLRKYYDRELRHGHIKANSRVAESLYRKATGEGPQSVTAAIFWLKTRAQWKETVVAEVIHEPSDSVAVLLARIADQGSRLVPTLPETAPLHIGRSL